MIGGREDWEHQRGGRSPRVLCNGMPWRKWIRGAPVITFIHLPNRQNKIDKARIQTGPLNLASLTLTVPWQESILWCAMRTTLVGLQIINGREAKTVTGPCGTCQQPLFFWHLPCVSHYLDFMTIHNSFQSHLFFDSFHTPRLSSQRRRKTGPSIFFSESTTDQLNMARGGKTFKDPMTALLRSSAAKNIHD